MHCVTMNEQSQGAKGTEAELVRFLQGIFDEDQESIGPQSRVACSAAFPTMGSRMRPTNSSETEPPSVTALIPSTMNSAIRQYQIAVSVGLSGK